MSRQLVKEIHQNWLIVVLGTVAVCVMFIALLTLRDPWLWLFRGRFDHTQFQAEYDRSKALWDSQGIDQYRVTIRPFGHQIGVYCNLGRIQFDSGLIQILEQASIAGESSPSSICTDTFKSYAIAETFAMAQEALAMLAQGDESGYWFEYFRLEYDPQYGFISMIDIKAQPIDTPTSSVSYFVLGVSARYEDFEAK